MRRPIAVLLLLWSAPLLAAPVTLPKSAPEAEDRLRAWLDYDSGMHAKIGLLAASAAPEAFAAEFYDMDPLKDAVAETPRRELVGRLPAMQVPQTMGCSALKDCAEAPMVLDVAAGQPLEHAIRAMLRPWIWLAEGRGSSLSISPVGGEGASILTMSDKGSGLPETALKIKPRTDGGFQLWFDEAPALAELYARERARLLAVKPRRSWFSF